jgi:hypothetical protein
LEGIEDIEGLRDWRVLRAWWARRWIWQERGLQNVALFVDANGRPVDLSDDADVQAGCEAIRRAETPATASGSRAPLFLLSDSLYKEQPVGN